MTNKIDISNYYKGCVEFNYDDNCGSFFHNISKDLHIFIIWEGARHDEKFLTDELQHKFNILGRCVIKWNEDNFELNIKRFYKFFNDSQIINNCKLKVRGGEFVCFIVEDPEPIYRYRQNVSGPIQLVNTNVLNLKRRARDRVGDNIVHSSGSPEEFFEQIALIFNKDQLKEIFTGKWIGTENYLNQDLVGTNGWKSFEELFQVLKYGTDYLVSRNYEYLPNSFFGNDKDVDIICSNYYDFVAMANVDYQSDKLRDYVEVENKKVIFDIRGVESNYLDPKWIKNILASKLINKSDIFIPRDDEHFFSLIYHACVQKIEIKEKYKPELLRLAKKLNLDFFTEDVFVNKEKQAKIIEGFMKANGYKLTKPKDVRVFINQDVIKFINPEFVESNRYYIYSTYKNLTPNMLKRIIPSKIKMGIKKIL